MSESHLHNAHEILTDDGLLKEGFLPLAQLVSVSGYAKDHIGRLARQGKVKAARHGKQGEWYVHERSLKEYQATVERERQERMAALAKTFTPATSQPDRPNVAPVAALSTGAEGGARAHLALGIISILLGAALVVVPVLGMSGRLTGSLPGLPNIQATGTAGILDILGDSVRRFISMFKAPEEPENYLVLNDRGAASSMSAEGTEPASRDPDGDQPISEFGERLASTEDGIQGTVGGAADINRSLDSDEQPKIGNGTGGSVGVAPSGGVVVMQTLGAAELAELRAELSDARMRLDAFQAGLSDVQGHLARVRPAAVLPMTYTGTVAPSIAIGANTLSSEKLTVSGLATLGSLTVPGTTTLGVLEASSGSITGNFTIGGNITVGGSGLVGHQFTVVGSSSIEGRLELTKSPTVAHTGSWPNFSNLDEATFFIRADSPVANGNIIVYVSGNDAKFVVDAEGDVFARNLVLTGSTTQSDTTVAGDMTVEGNTTFGDAVGDRIHFVGTVLPLTLTTPSIFTVQASPSWTGDYYLRALNSASAPVFTVASTGNVGVGTGTPEFSLDVAGSGRFSNQLTVAHAGEAQLLLTRPTVANRFIVWQTDGTARWRVGADSNTESGANAGSDFVIQSRTDAGSALRTDLRINRDSGAWAIAGNVGIGTTGPASVLHVLGSTPTIRIQPTTGSPGISFRDNAGSGKANIFYDVNIDRLTMGYGASAAHLAIDPNGNVGIGTTNPGALLQVSKSTSGGEGGIIFIKNANGSVLGNKAVLAFGTDSGSTSANGPRIEAVNTNASSGESALAFYTHAGAGVVGERMRIDANGNVGIGTTNPGFFVDVRKDQNAETRIRVQNTNTGSSAAAGVALVSDSASGSLVGTSTVFDPGSTASLVDAIWLNANSDASGGLILSSTGGDVKIGTSTSGIGNLNIRWQVTPSGHLIAGADNAYDIGASGANRPNKIHVGTGTSTFSGNVNFNNTIFLGTIRSTFADSSILYQGNKSTAGYSHVFSNNGDFTQTSGNAVMVGLGQAGGGGRTFAPTSGTGTFAALSVEPVVNQTGGASGITRGIHINPTLTAAADFRGLEISNTSHFGIYQSGASATNYFAGNVGIGTTGPNGKLHVKGSTRIAGVIVAGSGVEAGSLTLDSTNAAGGHRFNVFSTTAGDSPGAGAFAIFRDSAPGGYQLVIKDGNVGIETVSPGQALHVAHSLHGLRLQNTGAGGGDWIVYSTQDGDSSGGGLFTIRKNGDATTASRLVINSSGNVGIGTTNPTQRLDVETSAAQIADFNSTAANGGYVAVQRSGVARLYAGVELGLRGAGSANNAILAGPHSGDSGLLTLYGNYNVANSGVQLDSSGFVPAVDNVIPVGKSGQRWTEVWAVNGTIQTSDVRMKQNISDSVLGLEFVNRLRPVQYEYNDIPGYREGLIAQEVLTALDGHPFNGGVTYDDQSDRYGLNYSAFVPPLITAVQDLSLKIEELEGKGFIREVESPYTLEAILEAVRELLASGTLQLVRAVEGVFEKITTREIEVTKGITLYDEDTNEPYCLTIKTGMPTSRPGSCSAPTPMPAPAEESGTSDSGSLDASDSGEGGVSEPAITDSQDLSDSEGGVDNSGNDGVVSEGEASSEGSEEGAVEAQAEAE